MDTNLHQNAQAPMIALIKTKNIMNYNNLKNKTKRAAALLLMLALLVSAKAWAQSFGGGSGTQTDPYIILSIDHMNQLAEYTGSTQGLHFRLDADLDYKDENGVNGLGLGFKTIAHFSGTFDGNGHYISNAWVSGSGRDNHGLFGTLDLYGTIKNLNLVNLEIIGLVNVGGIVGAIEGGYVINCKLYNCFIMSTNYVGGIAGYINPQLIFSVKDCVVDEYSTVSGIGITNNSSIGGIVGYMIIDHYAIENNYFLGELKLDDVNHFPQGIIVGNIPGYDRNINYYNPELNSELPSSAVEGATPVYGIYDWQKVTEVVSGEVLSIPVTPNSTNSDTIGYAMPDTTIVLRQNPAEGYACSDFTAQGATLTHVSNDIYSFVMPNNSVTISATLCEPIAITNSPYFEDFESPAGTLWTRAGPIADCWKGYARYSGHKAPHNSIGNYYAPNYVHSGVQSLSFYNMGENYALFPEFSNPIYDLQVSFWMKTDGDSSTGSGQLQLGYITVEDDGTCNTFTEIATYSNNTDSMVQCSTTLENVSAEAHRLAFKWSATNYICFIDDVTVSLNLTLKPTDLTCTEVTNTSATLTWTSNAESWQIMLNDDETNLIMADTNPFTLTGLVPETFYTAKVRSYWDSDNQSEWSDPVSFTNNGICPEGMVCIGIGTQTNYNLPTSNYYKYGLTQQIYTADEIGQAGCITSIEFFKASAYTMTRNLDIYLVCTDKDEFENTSDWIPVTANDLVFSGAVTFADQDWTTITLDEPFNYYGTSNVAVVVDDNTGGFSYSLPFHVFSTEKEQTILYCDSNNNYDPTASPGNAISTTNEKNRIRLGMEELPGCERPTLLAVDTLGATSATLSWTENGEATAWQIMLNDDHTNLIEADSNPFTLDSLIPETIYTAKVRAHCPDGNGISLWSSPISFNPTRAFTIGAGTATNNDLPTNNFYKYSYTQQIYTTDELGEAGLIERIDFFKNSTAACNRNLDIYLVSTDKNSFDGGNDWIVTTEEDLVFSGTVNFADQAWTIITFDKPFIYNGLHNVAIIVDDHTGSYVSRTPFHVFDAPNQALSTYHDKGEKAVLGQKNQIRVLKSAMGDCINPTMLTASELNYYDATLTWEENGTSTEWVVDYWYLNSSNEEVHNQLTVADSTHCHIENLSDNTEYHAKVRPACDENKWSNTAAFTTLEACSVPVITLGTVTATTAELTWTGLSEGYTVMYRESIVRVAGEWQTLSVDEAAVTLTNLVPEADYEVKVIPSCDETKESAILTFTTANPCEVPTNLAVDNVTPTTAEISWDGVSLSGYEVEYYTATLIDMLLSEGFESGALPQGWTIEGDNQDPTKTWRVGAGDSQTSTGTHSGDYNALITHNNRDEVTYLIMPAFDLGDYDNAQLSFWYVNRNWASDIDEIGVFYRIGTEGEWNELWSTADAHATWTNQTLALTGLADNYQIGFRMIDHWGRGIGLDDIVVFHELAPAGEPMTLTVEEGTTATLTGLADNTTYEARVKANCYEAEYSQPVGFTTPACPAPVATLGTVTATTAELSWTASLCEGYTVKYREKYTPIIGDTLVEEHFDGDGWPEGWNLSAGTSISQTNHAGMAPNEVRMKSRSTFIQTPAIDLSDISQVHVSFRLNIEVIENSFPGMPGFTTGIATSSDGGATWHNGWEWTANRAGNTIISETIATPDMGRSNVLFRINWKDLSLTYQAFLDDVIMVGMLSGEWQDLHVTDTAVTLTNLSPNTTYDVKVVPDCDENKGSELLTFSTVNPCATPTNLAVGNITATTADVSWDGLSLTGYEVECYTVPLSEGFEGGTLPEGWTIEGDNQDPATTWRVGNGVSGLGPHSGDYNALITHNQNGNETFLVTPSLNLGAYESVELSFWYVNRSQTYSINVFDFLSVYYRIGEEGEWNELWGTRFNRHPNWTHQTLTLTDLADNYQIGFMMKDNNGRGVGLDDILISTIPSGNMMTLTVEEGTSATLTGLAANTSYEVRVKSNCDAAEYCSPVVFTTAEMETFTKEIVGYGESNGGYYLIASPVVEPIMPSEENGFLTNAFDLYRFNQNGVNALEWENWKAEENYHYPIENGRGYLYASHDSTTLTFSGTPYSGNGQVTLTKTDGVTFEGWNLVGNPFPTMAFIDDGRPFYTVNGDGSQIIGVVGHSIEVMEAIFVVAEEDGETMTFTTEMPALDASLSLNVMAAEPSDTPTHRAPTVIDRAIIRFGEGRQLPKFQLNGNSTKVYIPQGGMDYAVVCSEGKGELPLNFKAAKNGTYTLSVNMENMDFDYLHLIDNLTGADVDLLVVDPSVPEPVEGPNATGTGPSTSSGTSYTFTAKTTDYESRFKLVFSADEDVCEPNEAFAYINNGNIVITTDMGDATLQIVDVMGRVVASYSGHTRCVSTSGMTAGVYVLRLIDGENVRTQKIVVDF